MENIKNNTAVDAKENNTVAVEAKEDENKYVPFYDTKFVGVLDSYEIKKDLSVQFIFEETVIEKIGGVDTTKLVQYTIRMRPEKPFTESELKTIKGQVIEIDNIEEMPYWKKDEFGDNMYGKLDYMAYGGTSYKKSNEKPEGNFQLFRMFEINKVANVSPITEYNKKKRNQDIKKGECLVQYHVDNKGANRLKEIKIIGLDFKDGVNLVGKKIKVNDYKEGKTSSCTSYKEL